MLVVAGARTILPVAEELVLTGELLPAVPTGFRHDVLDCLMVALYRAVFGLANVVALELFLAHRTGVERIMLSSSLFYRLLSASGRTINTALALHPRWICSKLPPTYGAERCMRFYHFTPLKYTISTTQHKSNWIGDYSDQAQKSPVLMWITVERFGL